MFVSTFPLVASVSSLGWGMVLFSTFFSNILPIFKNNGEIFYINKGQMPSISKFYQFTVKIPPRPYFFNPRTDNGSMLMGGGGFVFLVVL